MSICVKDILKLPSMRGAFVLGGEGGLNKNILGVSVLESVNVEYLTDAVFQDGDYLASELVITGFLNCTDDVDTQCANIRRLAEGGEVGMVLFYVGSIMPEVDPRLIELADELDFVLIRMSGGMDRRYWEVIRDVSELLYRDQEKDENIVTDVLAALSNLPEQKRAVNTILKILSDRLRMSIVLMDSTHHMLNLVPWPAGTAGQIEKCLSEFPRAVSEPEGRLFIPELNAFVQYARISAGSMLPMELYLIKDPELTEIQKKQAVDAVRLGISLWGRNHDQMIHSELIRAILQDDPIKMRRLAGIFHVNMKDIHNIWIFSNDDDSDSVVFQQVEGKLKESLHGCCAYVISGFFEDQLVLCTSNPDSARADEEAVIPIIEELKQNHPKVQVFFAGRIQTVSEASAAYQCYRKYRTDGQKIFPLHRFYTRGEMAFVEECYNLITQGEDQVTLLGEQLTAFRENPGEWDMVETLAAFLLDTNASITKTAELLHVHKNTVKYRLKVIANTLGFYPSKTPDNIPLYHALAVHRLLIQK